MQSKLQLRVLYWTVAIKEQVEVNALGLLDDLDKQAVAVVEEGTHGHEDI
jgi:hypothetical protein